jgi:hypothetical protein
MSDQMAEVIRMKMKNIILCMVTILLWLSLAQAQPADYKQQGSLGLIEDAWLSGEISRGESPIKIVIRSGTPFVNMTLDNWDLLTPDQQAAAQRYLARPTTDTFYVSPDSHFAVHYDTIGYYQPPDEDLDSNGIPDYVERIALYADSSCRHYQDNLQFLPPPSDGDALYDIYLQFLGSSYGVTVLGTPGDSVWQDFSSHIQINFDLSLVALPNEDPEGQLIGAQKITCAHEYLHATQLAYAYWGHPNFWWSEGTATMFEDVVFEVVNDNYAYFPYFFNVPHVSLIDTAVFGASWHDYSTFIWPIFLAEKYGIGFIRSVFEHARYVAPLAAIDSALDPYGVEIEDIFPEFTIWNYYTNLLADTIYYDDGADYPLVHIDHTVASIPFSGDMPVDPPDALGCNYIMAYAPSAPNGLLKIDFDGYDYVHWGFSYIKFRSDSSFPIINCSVDTDGKTDCGIYDFVVYDSILFIPCVVTQWHKSNDYVFSTVVDPFGDVDGSGEINVFDITYLISYLYKGGLAPKYDLYMGDTNCDGNINLFDISHLIRFLYQGGPAPCLYRR